MNEDADVQSMEFQTDPTIPPVDEEYEKHIAQLAADYEKYLENNAHSKYYLALVEETLATTGGYTLLIRTRDRIIESYRKQILDIESDDSVDDYESDVTINSLKMEINSVKEGFLILSSSKLKSDYCLILNSLENYLICAAKVLLKGDPSKINIRIEVKLDKDDISDYIAHPIALQEYIIERILNNNDRFYNQKNVTSIIKKYIDFSVPEDMERSLVRAYEVRHKLTHLGGLIDEKLILDLKSNKIGQGKRDDYEVIGSYSGKTGEVYKVNILEMENLIKLVDKYAAMIDNKICISYSQLIEEHQADVLTESYLIALAIDSIIP